jgi:hypothetical protein
MQNSNEQKSNREKPTKASIVNIYMLTVTRDWLFGVEIIDD